MSESPTPDRTTVVDWEHEDGRSLADPLVRSVPYVELKLEHPDLAATSFGRSFFPAVVPYALGGEHRVFYWQPSLPPATPSPTTWTGVCATTDALRAVPHEAAIVPPLTDEGDRGTELVVDGTIGGDSTTAVVEAYDTPDVTLRHVTPDGVELGLPDRTEIVQPGARERFELPPRGVSLADSAESVSVTPELVVRFPGRRTLYHPGIDANYRLFPSFGLTLDDLPQPVSVPTQNGEFDYHALADRFDLDLSERPYPERVLWQAFAFSAFDPHGTSPPTLAQFDAGMFAVR